MALADELKAYMTKHGRPGTAITERHSAAIVGETHAFLNDEGPSIRTEAVVRLLLELLKDGRYRYFANESFHNAGPIRVGVRNYLRHKSLPPAFDPKAKLDVMEIARRVVPRRFQAVLDFLRGNPRYVLPIGSSQAIGATRDAHLAQLLFEEAADRGLAPATPGIVLLGARHAAAAASAGWPTTRMLMEKRGYVCVSIRVLTDFVHDGVADDLVTPLGAPAGGAATGSAIRLTALAGKTPVTIPTAADGPTGPFHKVALRGSSHSVAAEFEYLVLQKA